MTTDLSVCQDIFNRDPVRYLDMTEAVRRGVGTVLHASPSAALVGIPAADDSRDFGSYLMSCADMDAARLLCGLFPDGGDSLIAAHEDFYLPLLQDRFGLGFFLEGASFQAAYLGVGPCPIPESPLALRQLTVDHTQAQLLFDRGELSREELDHHPARNSLTRAVGVAAAVAADYTQCRLEPGDALLLCSDGLYSMVDPTTLRECARQSVSQEDSKCLIDAANSRGGRDNITAVIIWYEENRNG